MGGNVSENIAAAHNSCEEYVMINFADLQRHASAGARAQYRKLLDSAQTPKMKSAECSSRDMGAEDPESDDILEMHIANISLYEYKMPSGHLAGAECVGPHWRVAPYYGGTERCEFH